MIDHVPIVRARSGRGPRTRKAHLRIKARLGQRINPSPATRRNPSDR